MAGSSDPEEAQHRGHRTAGHDPGKAPEISVIVAVHNVSAHVTDAIRSLKAQSFAQFEALIIDDGSDDDSAMRAAAAIGDDPRFHLIHQENQGLSGARNTGLSRARGQFIAFLDGDDAFAPGFLQALHSALTTSGADWAACGVALVYPDVTVAHSGFHGDAPVPDAGLIDLRDACQTLRLFPSAWNKLYRRSLFETLRFPPGTWFEDHEVFWALSARTGQIAYVPQPLYHHRRARPGQITGADSDRVFEQFAVLARLVPLIRSGGFSNVETAVSRLATRLVHERALVLRDPDRQNRFLQAVSDSMGALNWRWDDTWDSDISAALGVAIRGALVLDVVVLDDMDTDRRLASVAAQIVPKLRVFLITDRADAPTHVQGHPVLRGWPAKQQAEHVLILGLGEALIDGGLRVLLNHALRVGAAATYGGLHRPGGRYHDGWMDNTQCPQALRDGGRLDHPLPPAAALRLYPMRANRIYRHDALHEDLRAGLCSADWFTANHALLQTALHVPSTATTAPPVAQQLWPARPCPAGQAMKTAVALPEPGPDMPRGWRGVLGLRRLKQSENAGLVTAIAALFALVRFGQLRTGPGARPDPEMPRWFRWLIRPWQR